MRCNAFEACERVYRELELRAGRCHASDSDCEREDRDAALSYRNLVEETQRELRTLRQIAQQAHEETTAARVQEQAACARRLVEPVNGLSR